MNKAYETSLKRVTLTVTITQNNGDDKMGRKSKGLLEMLLFYKPPKRVGGITKIHSGKRPVKKRKRK